MLSFQGKTTLVAYIILMISFFIPLKNDKSFTKKLALGVILLIPISLSIYTINCLVTGSKGRFGFGCNVMAWMNSISIFVTAVLIILMQISNKDNKLLNNENFQIFDTTTSAGRIAKDNAQTTPQEEAKWGSAFGSDFRLMDINKGYCDNLSIYGSGTNSYIAGWGDGSAAANPENCAESCRSGSGANCKFVAYVPGIHCIRFNNYAGYCSRTEREGNLLQQYNNYLDDNINNYGDNFGDENMYLYNNEGYFKNPSTKQIEIDNQIANEIIAKKQIAGSSSKDIIDNMVTWNDSGLGLDENKAKAPRSFRIQKEEELFKTTLGAGINLSTFTSGGGSVSVNNVFGDSNSDRAFNGITGSYTKTLVMEPPNTITIDYGSGNTKNIKMFLIWSRNDAKNENPRFITLTGSNDNFTTSTTLYTNDGGTPIEQADYPDTIEDMVCATNKDKALTTYLTDTGDFRYYKFVFIGQNIDNNPRVGVGELALYEEEVQAESGGASGIVSGASGIVSGASGIVSGASGVPSGASGILSGASGILSRASGVPSGILSGASGGASGILSGASGGASGILSGASGVPSGILSGASGILSGASGGASGILSGTDTTNAIMKSINEIMRNAEEIITDIDKLDEQKSNEERYTENDLDTELLSIIDDMNTIFDNMEELKNDADTAYSDDNIEKLLKIYDELLIKNEDLKQKRNELLILLFSPISDTDQTLKIKKLIDDGYDTTNFTKYLLFNDKNGGLSNDLTSVNRNSRFDLDTILESISQFNLEGHMGSMPTTEEISDQISSFAKNLGRDFGQGFGKGLSGLDIASSMQYNKNNGNTPSGVLRGNVSYSAAPHEDNKTKHCITNDIGEKCITVGPGIIERVQN